MRTAIIEKKVFRYNELSEKAQQKAIDDIITFYLETYEYDGLSPNMKKAVDKADKMQTPWFTGGYIWDYAKDEVLEDLMQYEYEENGEVFGALDI